MLITTFNIIIFHVSEWIKIKEDITHPLVRQEVGHNTWKSWWKVILMPASRNTLIKCNLKRRSMVQAKIL